MNPKRVLVTGGSGFIGTNLVAHHIASGDLVLNADIASPRSRKHHRVWKTINILDRQALAEAVYEFAPTHIVHLAARTDLHGDDIASYRANTEGVQNMVAACPHAPNLQRVIFASSRLVCRIGYQPKDEEDYCPPNWYGKSKVIGEQIVRGADSSIPWMIVRPTSIWGPWFDIPYRTFFMSIYRGRYLEPKGHNPHKSFGFVGNTVYEIQRLLDCSVDHVGRTLYLADYPAISLESWAAAIGRELGVRKVRRAPLGLLTAVAVAGDLLRRGGWAEPPLTTFRLGNLLTDMIYDVEPLRALVGQLPFDMEAGVRLTVTWLREEGLIQ